MNIYMGESLIQTLKEDWRRLRSYPKPSFSPTMGIDYDLYWEKRREKEGKPVLSEWQRERANIVLGMIEKGSTVLDIGCGDGAVLAYLQRMADIRGIGVDTSDFVLEQAKNVGIETIKMDVTDMNRLQELPKVDYITGFEIIEHMPFPEQFLHTLQWKARKGFIFSVPNTGYYIYRLRLLCGSFPMQWVAHPGEHLRFWTVRDMRFWVSAIGWNLRTLVLYKGIPGFKKVVPSLFAKGMVVFLTK